MAKILDKSCGCSKKKRQQKQRGRGFFDDALGTFGLLGNAVNPFAAGMARTFLGAKQAIKNPEAAKAMIPSGVSLPGGFSTQAGSYVPSYNSRKRKRPSTPSSLGIPIYEDGSYVQ